MKKIETNLQDCYIIEPNVFEDDRGYFMEFYSKEKMEEEHLEEFFQNAIQGNRSLSKKGTLRGLHFQKKETSQAKLVECLSGKVLDVVVDLRKDSPTYKKWTSVVLSSKNHLQLFIPKGFAHGFLTLEEDTLFQYLVDYPYAPNMEDGILWCDEELGIDWKLEEYGIEEPILSEKDKNRLPLSQKEIDF